MSGPAQPLPVDDAGLPEEVREIVAKARSSWLKNSEVFQILQHATSGLLPLSTSPPELPPGGTLFLIDRSSCRTFRKDQHQWRKKPAFSPHFLHPDNKTVRETHEKLKVGTTERLNCYYAHADQQDQLQRRCYWLLEQQYEYAVLVHYLNAPSTRTQRSVGGGLPAPDAAGAGDAPAPQRPQRANRGQNSRYAHLGFDQGSGSLGADGTPRASTTTGSDLDYEPAASGGYDVDDDAPNGGIPGSARHAPGSVAWLAAQHRPASPPGTASRLPRFPSDVSFGLGLMPEPSSAAGASLAAGVRRDAGSVQGSLPPSLAEQWAEHSRRGGAAPPLEELVGHAGGLLRAQRLHSSQQQQGQGVPGAFSPRGEAAQVAWPAPGATFDDLLSQHYAAALQRAQRADPDWEGEEGEGGARAGAAQPSAGLLMISRGHGVSFTASEADLARSLFPQLSLGLEGVEGSGASVTGPGGGGVGVQPSTGSFTAANGGGLDGFLASPQRLHSRRTSSVLCRAAARRRANAGLHLAGAARSASFEASVSGSEAAEPALRFAIEDFMPETALVLGGDKMFVTGSVRSAAGLWERHVHLKFGEEEVPAVVLNATVLKCNVPRAPTPGRVRLCVTLGDGVPVSNTVAFTYRHLRGLAALYLLLGRSLSSIALELVRHIRQAGGVLKSLSLGGRLVYRGVEIKRWHGLVAAYLAYKAAQALQGIIKYLAQTGQRRTLRRRMRSASSYEEWQGLAREWDRLTGAKAKPCLTACEAAELRELSGKLREARLAGYLTALRFTLRMDLKRRSGYEAVQRLLDTGIQCITLPAEVEEYLSEAIQALQHIVGTPALVHRDKVSFFRELRHAYGRTALVLSGGGSFGFFHYGVIKVLLNAGILPRIVAGSSAGALGAGILASRPVAQLAALVNMFPGDLDMNLLSNNTTPHILRHLVVKGTAQDGSVFVERLKRLYGADLTFADAYAVSGRILNVSVCAADTREPPRVLNYLSAPSVLVWSAVACSSAFPWLFAPRELLARDPHGATVPLGAVGGGGGAALPRRWRDGSLELDLPMRELGETFNVNYSIVSQANPWLLPVIAAQRLLPAGLGRALETEFKHRCGQALTFFPRSPLLKMVGQPWGGHVTLAMPAAAFGAGQAARNLSPADIARAVREGQLRAWRALPVMHAACAVEAAIDAALAQLLAPSDSRDGAATAQHPLPRKIPRASLPSWLHLPALGLPPSASLEHELGAHGSLAASLASLDEEAGEAGGSPLADAAPDAPMSYAAGDVAAAEHVWRDLAELSTRSHSALDCIAP
ncbi:hypothetical protein APUTEX25_004659 [Auxenochlorella protothecoides]|uniref:Patatin n=2 Tax=Auxenochlorella protothecoides TaxID=3075 RepID=A0A3M7L4N3_AUXPR|nr:hypothetical protein APUTEX25_004659 [Auxenochlorella protothecoides]|eukprot:RMZ56436.1 hypothetical protein APUTEX25_004659 [Auxenochlorella protothecoides]